MDRAQAERELNQMLEEASHSGRYYTVEEVQQHMEKLFAPENIVYLTGDTPRPF